MVDGVESGRKIKEAKTSAAKRQTLNPSLLTHSLYLTCNFNKRNKALKPASAYGW